MSARQEWRDGMVTSSSRAIPRIAVALLVGTVACASRGTVPPPDPVMFIERPAMRRGDSPPPRYPKELLATRDTGTVVLRVVVQPSGRVDSKRIEVISSPHPAFTRAAIETLKASLFIPAEVGTAQFPDCRVDATGVERCQQERSLKKVSQTVTVPVFFAPPPG
jgi:TonB family protein